MPGSPRGGRKHGIEAGQRQGFTCGGAATRSGIIVVTVAVGAFEGLVIAFRPLGTFRLFGLVVLAYMWARMAAVVLPKADGDETGFYKAKLATARFYMSRMLPQTSGLFAAIMAGKKPLMEMEAAAF